MKGSIQEIITFDRTHPNLDVPVSLSQDFSSCCGRLPINCPLLFAWHLGHGKLDSFGLVSCDFGKKMNTVLKSKITTTHVVLKMNTPVSGTSLQGGHQIIIAWFWSNYTCSSVTKPSINSRQLGLVPKVIGLDRAHYN